MIRAVFMSYPLWFQQDASSIHADGIYGPGSVRTAHGYHAYDPSIFRPDRYQPTGTRKHGMRRLDDRATGLLVAGFALVTRAAHLLGYLTGASTKLYYWPVLASTRFEETVHGILTGTPPTGPFVWSSPLYQYVMLPFYAAGAGRMGLFILQSLLAPLTAWLLFRTARVAGAGRLSSTVVALLWCLYAPAAFLELTVLPVALMTPMVLAFTLLQLRKDAPGRSGTIRAGLSGFLPGLLSGFRPPLLFLVAIPAIRWIRTRRPRHLVIGTIALALPLLFLSWQQHLAGGGFYPFPRSSGLNLVLGHNPDATGYGPPAPSLGLMENGVEDIHQVAARVASDSGAVTPAEADAYWTGIAMDYITDHPLRELELLGIKYAGFFGFRPFDTYYDLGRVSSFNPVMPFFFVPRWLLCGLFPVTLVPFCRFGKRRGVLLLPVALLLVTSMLVVHSERYFLPELPSMLVVAAVGSELLLKLFRERFSKGLAMAGVGLALMVPMIVWPVPRVPEPNFISSLAVRAYNMRDYHLALELFERTAVISEPGSFTWVQGHTEAAVIHRAAGRIEEALQHEAALRGRS